MRTSVSTEALVLAAADVGEEDRILTFLTPGRGLLRAAATSARNLKKGRAAPLDLFVRTSLSVNIPGREGKLKRISSVKVLAPYFGIRTDYRRLCAASYIGQTVAHCIQEDDPSKGVWDLVLHCMERLDSGLAPFTAMLIFEVVLLRELGVLPVLDRCMACSEEVSDQVYLDARGGGVYHGTCLSRDGSSILSGGDLAVLRYLAHKELVDLPKLSVKEDDARRLFDTVHSFSVHYLGFESKALGMMRS